jgi:uncharacterized protein (DUF1778 family)
MRTAAHVAEGKSQRFNIRATEGEKALVEHAARARHMTASQFMLQSALRSAEEILADQTRFVLPTDKWDEFVSLLDRPAHEVSALQRAASKPSRFGDR